MTTAKQISSSKMQGRADVRSIQNLSEPMHLFGRLKKWVLPIDANGVARSEDYASITSKEQFWCRTFLEKWASSPTPSGRHWTSVAEHLDRLGPGLP